MIKVTVGILAVIALAVTVGIGSCVYRGYRAVKDAFSGKQSNQRTSTAKRPDQVRPNFKPVPCSPLPSTPSNDEELASFSRASIPLIPGLTLVEAWASKTGDREAITRVVPVDRAAVRISFSGVSQLDRPMTATRTICQNDLLNAQTYVTEIGGYDTEIIHGATNFGVSRSIFKGIKEGKATFFEYEEQIRMTGPDAYNSHSFPGSLTRVEPEPVSLPMIVNNQRVELPAIHAQGDLANTRAEIYVLDDLLNPVTLHYKMQSLQFGIDMVKVSFPVGKPQLEQQLAEQGHVAVYGIYFDFGSAVIRPESEPILKEITDAMTENPSWKLSVEGHTDNIGDDSYNLDLSQRRAAAVKQALVERYHMGGDRLSTTGFGASRPIESNSTLAGRARNRRVELVRQ
jgi:outer membrane protein OmpA-like peptidoglycan-associated protein